MNLELDVTGVDRNRARFMGMARRADDLRGVGDKILDEFAAAERRHWNALPWPPLKKSTRDRKRRQGLSPRRMHATGLLERTLTRVNETSRAHGLAARVGRDEIVFGIKGGHSDIYYGRFHQRGQGVPKRVVVPKPTRVTSHRISVFVLEHIVDGD